MNRFLNMDKVVLLSIYFVVILESASSGFLTINKCKNMGPCIAITSCPSGLKLLRERNSEELKTLFCGFEYKYPKVCCSTPDDSAILFTDRSNEATLRTETTKIEKFDATMIQPETSINSDPFPNRAVCGRHTSMPNRIVGGIIAEITDFPWLARINYINSVTNKNAKAFCSASLITDRYLVTAAHCVLNKGRTKAVSVRLGEWDVETEKDCSNNICNDGAVDVYINKIIIHPLFDEKTGANDIALIRLIESVKFTDFIQPVCLPTTEYIADEDYVEGTSYWAAGWGLTEFGTVSAIKRKVQLEAVPMEICQVILPKIQEPSTAICAGGKEGIDTCMGDSGGSLVRLAMEDDLENWFLFGVTSSGGPECGMRGKPGVYTRITPFMDWINENVRT